MWNATRQGDAQTIENMIRRNGIDVNADISVSIIITLHALIIIIHSTYKHTWSLKTI